MTAPALFHVWIATIEGDRRTITVMAADADQARAVARKNYPGAIIGKIKLDRSGGIR